MKLLFENWRKYLNEESEDPDREEEFLDALNRRRQERTRGISESLKEVEEPAAYPPYVETQMPVEQIYCDMDGVLADFAGGVLDLVSKDLKDIEIIKKSMVKLVGIAGKFEYMLKMLKAWLKRLKQTSRILPIGTKHRDWQQNILKQQVIQIGGSNFLKTCPCFLPVQPCGVLSDLTA
jgi:hypothetical protein